MKFRLRRTRSLIVSWRDDALVFENYRTRQAVSADPIAVQLLHFFDRWKPPAQAASALPQFTARSVRAAVASLARAGLLVAEGTAEARQDTYLEKSWSAWLPFGGLHFYTKDVRFGTLRQTIPIMKRYLRESPQPPFFKPRRGATVVRLPQPGPPTDDFPRVLIARDTRREFSAQALTLEQVSRMLGYTWGVQGFLYSDLFGRLPHKTSPSGGARHPGEVYLSASRVSGVPPGLYRYDPLRHQLEQIRRGRMEERNRRYCAGQLHAKKAAALFLMTAVFPRTMWKYRTPRAYRVVLLDAGHLGQTLCLTATWLGLGVFTTAALKDTLIEKDLGIDGVTESVLYVAGVGVALARAGDLVSRSSRFLASL